MTEHDRYDRTLEASFSPAASSSDELTVYSVGEGEAFEAEKLTIQTVGDPSGNIDVVLRDGQEQVAPDNGRLTLATDEVHLRAGNHYDVGDDITLFWETNGSWTQTTVVVLVDGVEIAKGT